MAWRRANHNPNVGRKPYHLAPWRAPYKHEVLAGHVSQSATDGNRATATTAALTLALLAQPLIDECTPCSSNGLEPTSSSAMSMKSPTIVRLNSATRSCSPFHCSQSCYKIFLITLKYYIIPEVSAEFGAVKRKSHSPP